MQTGKKIRQARILRDLSQTTLSELVQLPVDRVRAYEACMRNPKDKQLQEFSDSLQIPMEYFTDHKIDTIEDAFMILFELEEMFGLSVKQSDSGEYVLSTDNMPFNMYLEKWNSKKQEFLDGKCTKEEYELWCARLRMSVKKDMEKPADNLHDEMIRQMEIHKKEAE